MRHLLTKVTPRIPTRVTRDALRKFCESLNKLLAAEGIDYSIESEARNGYVGVDLYQTSTNKCLENIACGKSRECAIEAERIVLITIVNNERNKVSALSKSHTVR